MGQYKYQDITGPYTLVYKKTAITGNILGRPIKYMTL